jgi:phosphate transport system substrate-binding protein
MKRFSVMAGFGVLCLSMLGCGGAKRLNGAGSSFVYPMMNKWRDAYRKEKKVEVNYQSKGSSAGIEMMTDRSVDYGATDAPMNDDQLEKAKDEGGEVVHIPVVMGGVVPAYNLPGLKKPLRFTPEILAKIYLGKITRWDDDELRKLNPKDRVGKLPDMKIKVVHRSDGSGTTYIFTDYLSKAAHNLWKSKGTSIKWATGIGAKGTEGVAGEVSRTKGAIGYIELNHALENKIEYGSVKNKAGKYIKASLESVTEAAKESLENIPDDLRYSIVNAPGEKAYPIAGTTWVVLYKDQSKNKTGKELVAFLRWIIHEGQEMNEDLNYARLPKGLVKRIEKKLDDIEVK